MKYAYILLSVLLAACSHPTPKSNAIIPEKAIDTSKYVVFKFDTARDIHLFRKVNNPADLSSSEIDKIEGIIAKKAAEYNKNEEAFADSIDKKFNRKEPANATPYDNLIHHPEKYYKQFLAITNDKGEKEVWVSCFCDPSNKPYWKKDWVWVLDGGSCYFQIKINLTTNTVTGFYVNGVA